MKRILYGLSLATLLATLHTWAANDCMDTSSYLTEKIDYKNLRLVDCNHDCYKDPAARIVDKQGKCTICGHFHIPRPQVIVKTVNPTAMPPLEVKKATRGSLARLFIQRMP